jgi:hypothetical protein
LTKLANPYRRIGLLSVAVDIVAFVFTLGRNAPGDVPAGLFSLGIAATAFGASIFVLTNVYRLIVRGDAPRTVSPKGDTEYEDAARQSLRGIRKASKADIRDLSDRLLSIERRLAGVEARVDHRG